MLNRQLGKGLVLYLPFEEGKGSATLDWSGNDNSGIIKGATWTNGKIGKALSFDGTDDYVDCGNDSSLNITDAITIGVWVYYKKKPGKWPAFVSKWNNYKGYMLWQRANLNIAFGVWDEAGNGYYAGEITLTEGWHHLVGVYDPSLSSDNVKLYVDGKQIGETADFTGKISISDYPLYIGCVSGQYFSGIIDEVRIYNRALSPEEIKALYEATKPLFYPKRWSHLDTFPGCVLNLTFEEPSGNIAYDISGFRNHGTIYGATRTNGKIGKALYFDGVDDYVRIPHTSILVPNNEWTIEGWFYYTGITDFGSIIGKSKEGGNYTYWVFVDKDDKLCSAVYSNNYPVVRSIQTLKKGRWYHFAITWQYPGEEKMYVNGVLENSALSKKDAIDTTGDVTIAELRPGRHCHIKGVIDEIKLYNRALSPEEIKALYYKGLIRYLHNPELRIR